MKKSAFFMAAICSIYLVLTGCHTNLPAESVSSSGTGTAQEEEITEAYTTWEADLHPGRGNGYNRLSGHLLPVRRAQMVERP